MTDTQPEALVLAVSSSAMADEGEMIHLLSWHEIRNLLRADATELRRLHAENTTLQAGYAAARLEIESLQARIKTMAEEHADELMVAHLDGRSQAAQPAGAQQPGAAYAALPDDREAFKTYLKECDECAIVPDVAGAFNAAWQIASHGQAPAQAAPAAVAGPSETVKFVDESTADPVEKARRYLKAMGDPRMNSAYFFDDGYPRRETSQDALATLAVLDQVYYNDRYEPSTDWAQGGPIIEREGISIIFHEQGHWTASNLHGTVCGEGPTPLIAGMRCLVASKLGDEVDVPEELL